MFYTKYSSSTQFQEEVKETLDSNKRAKIMLVILHHANSATRVNH